MTRHLSDDQLVDTLYGLASSPDQEHLTACALCRTRREVFEQRRTESAGIVSPAAAQFAAQRRAILARVAQPQPRRALAPALAAVGLLLVAAVFYQPGHEPQSSSNSTPAAIERGGIEPEISDLFAVELPGEPQAMAPLRELFEPVVDKGVDKSEER